MTVLGAVLAVGGLASVALAQDGADPGQVDVLETAGYLDPVLVDFISSSIAEAEAEDAVAVVLQLNSPGSVVSDEELTALATQIDEATVPVTVWIGPSGSRAYGGAAEIAAVADEIGMAPGTDLGEVGDQRLPEAMFGEVFDGALDDRSVDDEVAVDEGYADRPAPSVGLFVNDLDGFARRICAIGTSTSTSSRRTRAVA